MLKGGLLQLRKNRERLGNPSVMPWLTASLEKVMTLLLRHSLDL
jgi:hypothetical protein